MKGGVRIECPLCKKVLPEVASDFGPRPFCSTRCKLADLGNWLDGAYRISTPVEGDSESLGAVDDASEPN